MAQNEMWKAVYSEAALDFIDQNVISKRVAERIFKYRELLQEFPDLGAPYDPHYQAARPPFPCRYVYIPNTPFVLYYLKEDERRRIVIFCIDFARQDPKTRFSEMDW